MSPQISNIVGSSVPLGVDFVIENDDDDGDERTSCHKTCAEMSIRDEGTHHHFETLLYTSEPGLENQALPMTDTEWDSFMTSADQIGRQYNWTDISLGLHSNAKQDPSGANPMERFLTISPASSPLPWQARNALADLKCAEGNMPDAHRRMIKYAYENPKINGEELATDDNSRVSEPAEFVYARILKGKNRKRCNSFTAVQRDVRQRKRVKTIVRTGPRLA